MMIIDPPVNPFSPPDAIEAWLKKLATYPQDEPEVHLAIKSAKKALAFARSLEADLHQEPERKAA
jgi:hypothetical protein